MNWKKNTIVDMFFVIQNYFLEDLLNVWPIETEKNRFTIGVVFKENTKSAIA